MKSFPKLLNGPSPVGERNVDQLAKNPAQWLTSFFPGGVAVYKKGGKYQITVDNPVTFYNYLFGPYYTTDQVASAYIPMLAANLEKPSTDKRVKYAQAYEISGGAYRIFGALEVYIGGGYVGQLVSYTYSWSNSDNIMWWSLVKTTSTAREYLPSDPAAPGNSISYIESYYVPTYVNGAPAVCSSLVATGWDATTKEYRWSVLMSGYASRNSSFLIESTNYSGWARNVVCGGTVNIVPTRVLIPTALYLTPTSNQVPFASRMFCIGPGRLATLIISSNDNTVGESFYDVPFWALSNDHGRTWTTAPTPNGTVYGTLALTSSTDAYLYHNDYQAFFLASTMQLTYIGGGRSLMVIPNAWRSGQVGVPGGSVHGHVNDALMSPAIFIGDPATGFTQLNWPADAWQVGPQYGNEITTPPTPRIAALTWRAYASAHLSFGLNCFYMPVSYPDGWRIMFTLDAGSTWTISGLVPTAIVPPVSNPGTPFSTEGFAGTVLKPYVDATHPGSIIFAGSDAGTNTIRFFKTTGLFTSFVEAAPVKPTAGQTLNLVADAPGFYFPYTGNSADPLHKSYVYPAFPGEFDKP